MQLCLNNRANLIVDNVSKKTKNLFIFGSVKRNTSDATGPRSKLKKVNINRSKMLNLLNSFSLNEVNPVKTEKRFIIDNIDKMLIEQEKNSFLAYQHIDEGIMNEVKESDSSDLTTNDENDITRGDIEIVQLPKNKKKVYAISSPSLMNMENSEKFKPIALPHYWALHSQDEEYKIVNVNPNSKEYENVFNAFITPLPNVEVDKIERIQNPRLYSWYAMKKKQMKKKNFNDGNANEKWLFHATNSSYINCIKKEGLDPRLAKLSGSIGVGVYFSRSSSTTVSYTKESDDIKKMLYCRVLVGKSVKGKSGLLRPPYLFSTSELADSTHGDIGNDKMWSIFDLHQSYPEYVISFRYKTSKEGDEMH